MEKVNFEEAPYSSNYRKNNSNRNIDYKEIGDNIIEMVSDLIDDPKYKPFFYKRLYAIGPDEFLGAAEKARKIGFRRGRMFVKLLKEVYSRV